MSGASGLIGSALVPFLTSEGHRVSRLVRVPVAGDAATIPWDPEGGRIDPARLEGLDAVVHLAGESIASGRWNGERKAAIRESRVRGTRLLADSLARLPNPPRVFVCASAVGYYGDRGDEELDESSEAGRGFLAAVCVDWEAATEPAARAGIRVARLRFGVILSREGGALPKMVTAFRYGVGGRIGGGMQWMSWIALDDVVGAIHLALLQPGLFGPVNVVAPDPVRNREFARALGRVLHRPSLVPLPAPIVRLVLGEMGQELLLGGQRVRPVRLLEAGFVFHHADLDSALRAAT